MRRTAVIAGASGTIGFALATVFARNDYDVVLVARSAVRLSVAKVQLENRYGITAHVISADLTKRSAPGEVFRRTESAAGHIDVLVNNTSFAQYQPFHQADRRRHLEAIALNITVLTDLTYLFLRPMILRRAGKILNVVSAAAFSCGPLSALYYASRSYVVSFSAAVRHEVLPLGVEVTTLCAGHTKTELWGSQPRLFGSPSLAGCTMSAEEVAEIGYKGLMRGKAFVIPRLRSRAVAWNAPLSHTESRPDIPKVLLIGDVKRTHKMVKRTLEPAGFALEVAPDVPSGLAAFRSGRPAVVILDVMPPMMSVRDVIREIRKKRASQPVIIFSGTSQEIDSPSLMDLRADDYVTKPLSPREILARVKTVTQQNENVPPVERYSFADVAVDFDKMEVTREDRTLPLTLHELKTLKYFTQNPKRVISREELLNQVWGYEPTFTRRVDNYILSLRQKLEKNPAHPLHFRTIRGAGYKFVPSS